MLPIIGHQRIIKFLQKSIVNNRLAHAYLFYGPAHIGKSRVAEYLAASLICENHPSASGAKTEPCGKCVNCQQVFKGLHPDVIWISRPVGKSQISINQIRQLKANLSLTPLCGLAKIAIIKGADDLTIQAANSFLKLLEEAPKKTVIILVARSFYSVFSTLRSRCQILRFSFPPKKEIILHLVKSFGLTEKKAKFILALALGRPGLAIDFAKHSEKVIEHVELAEQCITLLAEDTLYSRFKLAGLILNSPNLNGLLQLIRDLILIKLGNEASDDSMSGFKKIAKLYSKERLTKFAFEILKTQFWLSRNVNQKLAIENLLINF